MSEDQKKFDRRKFLAASIGTGVTVGVAAQFKLISKADKALGNTADRRPAASYGSKLALDPNKHALNSHYDVVIIGSGYGASVIAARLAQHYRGSRRICVLERGREYGPGQFPKTQLELAETYLSLINPYGFIDHHMAGDLDIVGASGLGGTSLLNAAISLRPEMLTFEQREWPSALRKAAAMKEQGSEGGLTKFYDKAEAVLHPQVRPDTSMAKASLMRRAFEERGIPSGNLPLNINYNGATTFGVDRKQCANCGDCCGGCNYGAKNSLDKNYLAIAAQNGAEIFTSIKVTSIEKESDGSYTVNFDNYNEGRFFNGESIRAKTVVLGAGSKGSTQLLLESQTKNFEFSPNLGHRLSANGDVLGFAYNTDHHTNIIGFGTQFNPQLHRPNVGQGLNSFGDYRKKPTGKTIMDRFLMIEGSVPSSLATQVAKVLAMTVTRMPDKFKFSPKQWARVEADLRGEYQNGAFNHSLLLLACGHDSANGRYSLDKVGQLKTTWHNVTKERSFVAIKEEMKKQTEYLGGQYLDNPLNLFFKNKMVATHPLGGCPMGDHGNDGVVNHKGQVFDANSTLRRGVHRGLYVVDAAVMPRSLGVTPLLTISALAERMASLMIEENAI